MARRHLARVRRDRGALSPVVAILAVMIFALAGLVIDGGRQLGAKSRAIGYAQEAARAGAAAIDLNSDEAKIDTVKAQQAVAAFCTEVTTNDPAVKDCETTALDTEHLVVHVRIENATTFLGMVGTRSLDANGQGEAHAEQGIKKADETPTIPSLSVLPTSEDPGAPTLPPMPPTLDVPCPSWTIGSPQPPPADPSFPFPATCSPTITPSPTATDTSSPPPPSPSTSTASSSGPSGPSSTAGGGPAALVAPSNSAPPVG